MGLCSVTPWSQLSAVQVQLHPRSPWGFSLLSCLQVGPNLPNSLGRLGLTFPKQSCHPRHLHCREELWAEAEVVFGRAPVHFLSLPEVI